MRCLKMSIDVEVSAHHLQDFPENLYADLKELRSVAAKEVQLDVHLIDYSGLLSDETLENSETREKELADILAPTGKEMELMWTRSNASKAVTAPKLSVAQIAEAYTSEYRDHRMLPKAHTTTEELRERSFWLKQEAEQANLIARHVDDVVRSMFTPLKTMTELKEEGLI